LRRDFARGVARAGREQLFVSACGCCVARFSRALRFCPSMQSRRIMQGNTSARERAGVEGQAVPRGRSSAALCVHGFGPGVGRRLACCAGALTRPSCLPPWLRHHELPQTPESGCGAREALCGARDEHQCGKRSAGGPQDQPRSQGERVCVRCSRFFVCKRGLRPRARNPALHL